MSQGADAMAKITATATISDHLMPFLDNVRDKMKPEDFYRKALQIGITTMIENAARRSNDHLQQRLGEENHDYEKARAVLRLEPPPEDSADSPKNEITSQRRLNSAA